MAGAVSRKTFYVGIQDEARNLKRGVLASLAQNFPEDLVNRDDRHNQVAGILDGGREQWRAMAVREVFEPAGGINDVRAHRRSASRSMLVSMSRRKPRNWRAGRTGINSTRPA